MMRRYLSKSVPVVMSLLAANCTVTKDGGLELSDDTEATEGADTEAAEDAGDGSDDTTDTETETETEASDTDSDASDAPDAGAQQEPDDGTDVDAVADASVDQPTGDGGEDVPPGETPDSALDAGVWDASWPVEQHCTFSSEPVPFVPNPDAGADAGPPAGPHIMIGDNSYLGPVLTDGQGYTLYIYTADLPGDCEHPPVSTCFDDCVLSWPIFEAGDRELGEGLDPAQFGTFLREDGVRQTTYQGWPLYYYKKDLAPEDALGQGRGKVWYIAETNMPNLLIMRAPEEMEGIKYLADGRGRTLYAYEGDDEGSETRLPSSNCDGECSESLRPFMVRSLYAVTELEPDDVNVFPRSDGLGQQVSYRGRPLYLANEDERSGDMNGLEFEAFSLVEP